MDGPESQAGGMRHAAQEAERAGDLAAAVCAWQAYRELAPEDPEGFGAPGKLLVRLGFPDLAQSLLQQGRERFPDHEWLAIDHAWLTQEGGDAGAALACCRSIHERFPDNLSGYIGLGLALRRVANFDAADDLYRSAIERFPPDETLYTEFAWSAEERRDAGESIRRWDKVRAHFPQLALGYVRGGILLRDSRRYLEADAILKRATERFPDHAEAAMSYAWTAHRQRDWPEALKRWELVVMRFPELAEGRCGATEVLMEMERYAEAANVLSPAARMFPDHEGVALLGGRLGARRGDVHQAVATWKEIHERFPHNTEAWRNYAGALADAGQSELAESVMLDCTIRFPDDPQVALEFARFPVRRQNWPLAIERWRQVLERFPQVPDAYMGLGESLLNAGQETEAKAIFQAGREHFPGSVELDVAEAQGFERLKDWPQAVNRWSSLTLHQPNNPAGFLGLSRALGESGQPARSVEVLQDALKRFPDNLELEMQLALALSATGDWQQAVERWEHLRRRFPEGHLMATRAFQMMEAARLFQPELFAVPAGDSADPVDAAGDSRGLEALLKRFESLGDDCEFGLVQKIFHADALNLLRWGRTLPDNLLKALEARFEGVGEPEHTIIRIQGNEYMTEDRRFSMLGHTFTPPSMIPLEVFAVEQCRRMQWLRRKLLNHLEHSSKIFVYKTESVTDAEILAIYDALRRYSADIRLLFVRLKDETHPAGTLERVTGNLFVGRMDKFSTIDISISIWIQLCRDVAAQLEMNDADTRTALSS